MRNGLGVVTNANGSYYVPGWCSWLPFSSFNDACKLPTAAQSLADQMSNLGPAARNNPVLVESLQNDWRRADAMMAAENPEQAAEYAFAMDNPAYSATFGTGAVARTAAAAATAVANLPGQIPDFGGMAALAGAAVIVLLLLRSRS